LLDPAGVRHVDPLVDQHPTDAVAADHLQSLVRDLPLRCQLA
jgi:hypothetical protein